MRRQRVVLLAGSAIACADAPTAPEPSPPTAAARTTVYVIGGVPKSCGAGLITDAVKAYDVRSDTWTPKARYPVRVQSTNGAAELGGRIYVSGGFTRRWEEPDGPWRREPLKSLYVYTPSTNMWVRKRDMPAASVNGASVAYQGRLYVVTGSVVYRYTPTSDQWSVFVERQDRDWWDVSAGMIGGKLYLVEQFGRTWTFSISPPAPGPRAPNRPYRACNMASTSFQAKLYLFGFCDDYPADPVTRDRGLVFDPVTGAWSEVLPAPIPGGADAALARVFVNAQRRLSPAQGVRPNNHYLFVPERTVRPSYSRSVAER